VTDILHEYKTSYDFQKMSVTITWHFISIPDHYHEEIAFGYQKALVIAKKDGQTSTSAVDKWKDNPQSFNWWLRACDVTRHYEQIVPYMGDDYHLYVQLFRHQAFESLFYKYMLLGGARDAYQELDLVEIVITLKNDPPAILYQCL